MARKPCVLVLEDGTEFFGYNFGSRVLPVDGEVGTLSFSKHSNAIIGNAFNINM